MARERQYKGVINVQLALEIDPSRIVRSNCYFISILMFFLARYVSITAETIAARRT